MAPLEQYLIPDEQAEIALARTAAPKSVSDNAEVMVLGRQGYRTAVKGTNGFTCLVFRSWTGESDWAEFWNPRLRAPICFNREASRTYLAVMLLRTRLLLAGEKKDEAFRKLTAALDKGELRATEPGAMCFMLSRQQYLNDDAHNWHPHLMFFLPQQDESGWGAKGDDSPVLFSQDPDDKLTVYMVPLHKWSDGTDAP